MYINNRLYQSIMITWSLFRLSGFDNVEFTKLKDDWRLRIITAIGEIHKLLLSDNKMYPVSFPCGFLHDIYRKKVVSPDGASPYYLFPGCIVTPDPTVTRYFNGKTKKCMGTSVMTPSNTELMTSVQKWTQDFFERFLKSEWSYNIGVYGNVFCLDKSTWSPSFKVRIVAD